MPAGEPVQHQIFAIPVVRAQEGEYRLHGVWQGPPGDSFNRHLHAASQILDFDVGVSVPRRCRAHG